MHHAGQSSPSLWERLNFVFSAVADHTVLYQRGGLILVTFGALVTIGCLLWMLVTGACLLGHGLSPDQIAFFMIGAGLAALLSAHGLWWLENLPRMLAEPWLGLRHVGFVSWGGLAGALGFTAAFSVAIGFPLLTATDAVMRGLFGAYAIGRIGCLTYGCCYGRTAPRHGVTYRNPEAKVVREHGACVAPRHPTQMYSAAVGVVLFVMLNALPYCDVGAGLITAMACLLYPLGRAWVEAFRDRRRYVGARFTGGHLACLIMFLSGCLLLATTAPNGAPAPRPLSLDAIQGSLALAPAMLVTSGLVFLTMGVHWKRVGSR